MYEDCIRPLLETLDDTKDNHGITAVTILAERLIKGAVKNQNYLLHDALQKPLPGTNLTRNFNDPVHYTADKVFGAPWADDAQTPLQDGEAWNAGRRQTANGIEYEINEDNLPVNPVKTGMSGRNFMGRFGPNHAVDIGALTIQKNSETGQDELCVLGIFRKFNDDKRAFCGGFLKLDADENGQYNITPDVILETRLEEMFEEMISGSISLLPEYASRLNQEYIDEVKSREDRRDGEPLKPANKHEIYEQIETALKLEQVRTLDPGFLERLKEVLSKSIPCYAGPSSTSGGTQNAWVETFMDWLIIDEETWDYIKGENPRFSYDFIGGDDASDVGYHPITADIIQDAFSIHGSLFAYAAAAYLLKEQNENNYVEPSILNQLAGVADYFESLPDVDPELLFNKPSIAPDDTFLLPNHGSQNRPDENRL